LPACACEPRRRFAGPAGRFRARPSGSRRRAPEQRRYEVGLSTTFLVTQAQRDLLEAQVNLLQTSLDHESALVNFEAVQQAAESGVDAGGSRGAEIAPLPAPSPRGLFRAGGA
jgi:hypothetical protein